MDAILDDVGSAQRALIAHLSGFFESDPRIEGAWLVGSLARRLGDRFSDVDLLVAVADSGLPTLVEEWPSRAATLVDVAFAKAVHSRPAGTTFTHVTCDYVRFDITFARADQAVERGAREGISFLAPSSSSSDMPPDDDTAVRLSPDRVQRLCEEFLRVLGLLPVVIGRHQYLVAASGAALLRSMLMDLFTELAAPGYRGGAMRSEASLSPDQREVLYALPPLLWTRDAAIDLHLACARRFLPAARRAYRELGLAWPQPFEDAVRLHLNRELGLTFD